MKASTAIAVLAVLVSACAMLISTGLVRIDGMDPESRQFNPNDPIYTPLAAPNETWTGKFGDSERTRTFFNLGLALANDRALNASFQEITKRIENLEASTHTWDGDTTNGKDDIETNAQGNPTVNGEDGTGTGDPNQG